MIYISACKCFLLVVIKAEINFRFYYYCTGLPEFSIKHRKYEQGYYDHGDYGRA